MKTVELDEQEIELIAEFRKIGGLRTVIKLGIYLIKNNIVKRKN